MGMSTTTKMIDLGVKNYAEVWRLQEQLLERVKEEKKRGAGTSNYLLFVEHPHVYTLGKSGDAANMLINGIQLQAKHAEFIKVDRGGDITYHGPGQLVVYPIIDMENFHLGVKEYVARLEEVVIRTVGKWGVKGERLEGATGVWIDTGTPQARKICAIGVKCSGFVTMHGFALNVNTDLNYFSYINPCGFIDKGVTSIEKERGHSVDLNRVKADVKSSFGEIFGMAFETRTPLEICAYSLESCIAAKEAGADRVELCAAMYDGGTTPSAGLIQMARLALAQTELFVMIRPRGGDFLYSEQEFEIMKKEIEVVKTMGVDGVVLGILNADGQVDVARTKELVKLAAPLKVTFHRAFDMTCDYRRALEEVIETGCYRILTSGLHNTAVEGIAVIGELVKQAAGRIRIMAGSGVNAGNALMLAATGADDLHMSGKSVRDSAMIYRNPAVFMGGVPGIPEYDILYSDPEKIREVVKILEEK